MNEDLRLKSDDAISRGVATTKELEEVSQQFQSLKVQYTEKVSQLEIYFQGKDVSIKLLEEELATAKALVLEKDAQIASFGESRSLANQDVVHCQKDLEQSNLNL